MGKRPGRRVKLGIFHKLVGAFLVILIPVYIIGLLMNDYGAGIVRNEIAKSMEQKSAYILASLQTEITRVTDIMRTFINDSDLNDLSIRSESLTEYERTKAYNDLFSKIVMLGTSSKYIQDVFVMMPIPNKRISSRTGVEPLDAEEWKALQNANAAPATAFYYKDRLFFSFGYPPASRSQFMLVVEMSLPKIGQEIKALKPYEHSISYLLDEYYKKPLYEELSDGQAATSVRALAAGKERISIDGTPYMVFEERSEPLNWTLTTLIPENEILHPVYSFKKWIWYLSVLSFIFVILASFAIFRLIDRPLKKLIGGFRKVELGDLDVVIQRKENDEFQFIYAQFNRMAGKLKQLIQEVYEKTIYSQQAELKLLQSQINPHFLYNSLYILYLMAHSGDHDGVKKLAKYLGEYFKFITYNKSEFIPLKTELKHAQMYAAIQEIRFRKRISCRFEAEGDVDAWEVPRLIIQPILENAFIHGLEHKESGGSIVVAVEAGERQLTVRITDNGVGINPKQLELWQAGVSLSRDGEDATRDDIHGLENVHRRLKLLYGSTSGVGLSNNIEQGGVTAIITIDRASEKE